jgi:hypothetical protein
VFEVVFDVTQTKHGINNCYEIEKGLSPGRPSFLILWVFCRILSGSIWGLDLNRSIYKNLLQ